jgi:tetratricopeptide (TPR) repeat protein
MDTDVRIQCFEQYLQHNHENIDAMLDLAHLYENTKHLEKAKAILNLAVEKAPNDQMTWLKLGLLCEEMNDFEGAAMAFEKQISVTKEPVLAYINLAQAFLPIDIDKAAKASEKAQEFNKSAYGKKQIKAILNYEKKLKQGNPYEAGLQLIRSGTVTEAIEKAVIKELLRKYPNIKNSARNELEKRL